MSAPAATQRWGNLIRERKAAAILDVLRQCSDVPIGPGLWLDIGCGSGGIAVALAAQVDQVVGVDPEPWLVWTELAANAPNLSFARMGFDGDSVDIAAGSVSVAVCNQVYEHVSDPLRLLHNIAHVLKPGGYCYFAGPNLLWPIEPHVFWPFVHWLPRRYAQALMRMFGSSLAASLDAHSSTVWTLRRWFRDASLHPRQALVARIAAELELRGWRRFAHGMRLVPQALLLPFVPLAPSFVYVLIKR